MTVDSSVVQWTAEDWTWRIMCIVTLVALAALFSGLTLGLMTLDKTGLEIIIATGEEIHASDDEKTNAMNAKRIYPVRNNGNLLLTTLLFGNVAVNSLLAILMAHMTSGLMKCIRLYFDDCSS